MNTNSLTNTFDRIVQANSRYYVLGYYPPTHPRDGRFHRIEVKTKRPGLRVAARSGYGSPRGTHAEERKRDEEARRARDARAPECRQDVGRASRHSDSPLQQSGLNFTVQAAPFKNTQKEASVALAIELDGDRLPYSAPNAKGLVANKIELSFFGLNDLGKALAGTRHGARSHAPARDARTRQDVRRPREPADQSSTGPLSPADRGARSASAG